jgi:MFS transporter, ACS family, hexuronate transporter
MIVIYLFADVGSIGGGVISSYLIGRGTKPVKARLWALLVCAICVLFVETANFTENLWVAVLAISLAICGHQAYTTNLWSMLMDSMPKQSVGTVFGIGGMTAAIAGMFMTKLVGWILTVTNNNFTVIFVAIPGAYFVSILIAWILSPRK